MNSSQRDLVGSSLVKSHAGIFVRVEGVTIKGGQESIAIASQDEPLSAVTVHQKMRWQLLHIAQLETCELNPLEQ